MHFCSPKTYKHWHMIQRCSEIQFYTFILRVPNRSLWNVEKNHELIFMGWGVILHKLFGHISFWLLSVALQHHLLLFEDHGPISQQLFKFLQMILKNVFLACLNARSLSQKCFNDNIICAVTTSICSGPDSIICKCFFFLMGHITLSLRMFISEYSEENLCWNRHTV